MADNIINIATLTIDKKEATDSIVETKQRIFELQKANSALRKDILDTGDATGEQTKKFVQNEAELKQLTASYRAQQTAVNELTLAEVKETKALTENVNSIMAAKAQNKELLNIRNQIDTSTKEGEKAIELLNAKINENTKYIVENGTEQEKASHITGNYRQKLFDQNDVVGQVTQGFKDFRTVVGGFAKGLDESADKVTNFASGLATSAKAQIGFGNSTKVATVTTEAQTVATKEATATQIGFKTGLDNTTTATEKTDKVAKTLSSSIWSMTKIGIIGFLTLIVVALVSLYKSFAPITDAINGVVASFKSLGSSIMSVVKFLAMADFSSAGTALSDLGDNATKAYNATVKLNKSVRELESNTANLSVSMAISSGKEKEFQAAYEDTTKSMDLRSSAIKSAVGLQQQQLKSTAILSKQELNVERQRLEIALNGRKLTKELLNNDSAISDSYNNLQKKRAELYSKEQELRLFNLQKSKKIADANVEIADDEFKIVTGSIKKQVELLDTKLQREGITSKEISSIVSKEQQLKMQALGEYDKLFKKVTGNKIGASSLFDEKGFVRIGINVFDMAKKFQLSANQADRLRDMLGEYKDIDDRIMAGKSLQSNALKKEASEEKARQLKALEDKKTAFKTEVHTADEKLKFYTKHYESLNKIQGGSEAVKNAQEQSKIILEIATSTIDAEIELQKTAISEKKKISEEEKNELIKNAEFLKEAENGRIEQSTLNEQDKAAAKLEIEKGYNESLAIINKTFKDSEIARKEEEAVLNALEHENKLLLLEEQGYSERDLKLAVLQAQYAEEKRLLDEKLANDKISQEAYNATKAINEKKFMQASKKIDDETTKQKKANQMNLVKSALSAAQAIFGESKELAIASALLNTYEGISAGVALGFPMAIPAVAMAAATGFKAVQSILSTNPGSGAGGDTASPTATATAQFENPARTTSIATTNQTPSSVTNASGQPILILESLKEAQTNQQVKIKST